MNDATKMALGAYAAEVRRGDKVWREYVNRCTEAGKRPEGSLERKQLDKEAGNLRHERTEHVTRLRHLRMALDKALIADDDT